MTVSDHQPGQTLQLPASTAGILEAARLLRHGGVVAVPTDTLYGLAASIFQPAAIERVFEIKQRPREARVPILLATAADLPILVRDVPRIAWKLIDEFWPGPLTLVLPSRPGAPRGVTLGGPTVAVRVPAGRTCLELLQVLGEPVVGTSANISGASPATSAAGVMDQLAGGPDAVLVDDDGVTAGVSSTVVEITEGPPTIHRIGAVSVDQVRQCVGISVHVRSD